MDSLRRSVADLCARDDDLRRVVPSRVAALSEARLRNAGLTRQKATYCRILATKIIDGELDLGRLDRLADDAVRDILLQVPGVGRWTADIYLLMALHRSDVWPEGDLALAKAASRVKRLRRPPSPDRLRRLAKSWAPWRAVAARILWHAYLSEWE